MILSTRGWGPESFRSASLDFIEAARFALFAEKLAPMLAEAREVQNTPFTKGMSGEARLKLATAKREAAKAVPLITRILYPEDDEIV